MRFDDICDLHCNTPACDFDNGKCAAAARRHLDDGYLMMKVGSKKAKANALSSTFEPFCASDVFGFSDEDGQSRFVFNDSGATTGIERCATAFPSSTENQGSVKLKRCQAEAKRLQTLQSEACAWVAAATKDLEMDRHSLIIDVDGKSQDWYFETAQLVLQELRHIETSVGIKDLKTEQNKQARAFKDGLVLLSLDIEESTKKILMDAEKRDPASLLAAQTAVFQGLSMAQKEAVKERAIIFEKLLLESR